MPSNTEPSRPIGEKTLRYFEVSENGTITDPTVPEPRCNRDVFSNVSPQHLDNIDDLVFTVENCYPLARHFAELANSRADEIASTFEAENDRSPKKYPKDRLNLIELMRSDPADDDGWRAWFQLVTPEQLPCFKELIETWLNGSIDWDFSDWFDRGWSPQDAAMYFFESEDQDVLEALDVVIVEGENPGSTYYAAELQQDLDEANGIAAELNLDYRFRMATT